MLSSVLPIPRVDSLMEDVSKDGIGRLAPASSSKLCDDDDEFMLFVIV